MLNESPSKANPEANLSAKKKQHERLAIMSYAGRRIPNPYNFNMTQPVGHTSPKVGQVSFDAHELSFTQVGTGVPEGLLDAPQIANLNTQSQAGDGSRFKKYDANSIENMHPSQFSNTSSNFGGVPRRFQETNNNLSSTEVI